MRKSVRKWSLWKRVGSYFPARLVKTVDLDPTRNYLMCIHPHGICVHGLGICLATEAVGFSQTFPGMTNRGMTLSFFFKLPFMRELLLSLGMCSSSMKCLTYILTNRGYCKQKGQVIVLNFKDLSKVLNE